MTPLRRRMVEGMQLRGLSEKTQDGYVRAVRQLAEHYDKSPQNITDEELRQYFLHLMNVKHLSPSTAMKNTRAGGWCTGRGGEGLR